MKRDEYKTELKKLCDLAVESRLIGLALEILEKMRKIG